MKIILPPGQTKNVIVTIAIGEKYFNSWLEYSLISWKAYCNKYDLGLIVLDEELIDKQDSFWKKATWQKMLIGEYLLKQNIVINNICYLDTDFLLNIYSPNIFNFYNNDKIGLVSQVKNLPYNELDVKKRIAFFRHNFYDKNYPLDSALFMNLNQIFSYHNLSVQNDYACAGLILFNQDNHSELMRKWFYKYEKNIDSITGGGDECHFNYEVQSWGNIQWLDYKFQALWTYEMAWKYPFLYNHVNMKTENYIQCIEASLFTNYFLHFAGSWHESDMWKYGSLINSKSNLLEQFIEYDKTALSGSPKGIIKPKL